MVRLPGSEILLIIAAEDMGIPTPAALALTRSQCTPQPRLFLLLAPPTDPPCL